MERRDEASDWKIIQVFSSMEELKKACFPQKPHNHKSPWRLEDKVRRECCEQLVHRLVIFEVIRRWAGCAHCSLQATPGETLGVKLSRLSGTRYK